MPTNKTTTIVVMLAVVAGIIGYKNGFWSRLGGTINGTIKVKGNQ